MKIHLKDNAKIDVIINSLKDKTESDIIRWSPKSDREHTANIGDYAIHFVKYVEYSIITIYTNEADIAFEIICRDDDFNSMICGKHQQRAMACLNELISTLMN